MFLILYKNDFLKILYNLYKIKDILSENFEKEIIQQFTHQILKF